MLDRIEIRLWRIETVGFSIPPKNVIFWPISKNTKNSLFLISGPGLVFLTLFYHFLDPFFGSGDGSDRFGTRMGPFERGIWGVRD